MQIYELVLHWKTFTSRMNTGEKLAELLSHVNSFTCDLKVQRGAVVYDFSGEFDFEIDGTTIKAKINKESFNRIKQELLDYREVSKASPFPASIVGMQINANEQRTH